MAKKLVLFLLILCFCYSNISYADFWMGKEFKTVKRESLKGSVTFDQHRVEIGNERRTAYIRANVIAYDNYKNATKMPEYRWTNYGTNKFIDLKGRLADQLSNDETRKKIIAKMNSAVGVARHYFPHMIAPEDLWEEWNKALAKPYDLTMRQVRAGEKFMMVTGGSPKGEKSVQYPGSGFVDDYSIMLNVTAGQKLVKLDCFEYSFQWQEKIDGEMYLVKNSVLIPLTCINGPMLTVPEYQMINKGKDHKPGLPAEPETEIEPDLPWSNPIPPESMPPADVPEFDVRNGGVEIGVFAWVQGSTITSDSGNIDTMKLSSVGLAAEATYAHTFGGDDADWRENWFSRSRLALGGQKSLAIGEEQSDEDAGTGFGPYAHFTQDFVKKWFNLGIGAYYSDNPNGGSLSYVANVDVRPVDGKGVVGGLNYLVGQSECGLGDLDIKTWTATVGFGKGQNTPLPIDTDGQWNVRIGYSNQEYEFKRFARTTSKGPRLSAELLLNPKHWDHDEDAGYYRQRGVQIYGSLIFENMSLEGDAWTPQGYVRSWEADNQKAIHARIQIYLPAFNWGGR